MEEILQPQGLGRVNGGNDVLRSGTALIQRNKAATIQGACALCRRPTDAGTPEGGRPSYSRRTISSVSGGLSPSADCLSPPWGPASSLPGSASFGFCLGPPRTPVQE